MSLSEWQAAGFDKHSVFADPQFVNPEAGDYRVKDGSPALELGFKNFPMDKFGTRDAKFKAMAAKARDLLDKAHVEVAKKLKYGQHENANSNSTDVQKLVWNGATVKKLSGMDELSAVGLSSNEKGLFVIAVAAGSLAEKIGLSQGDVILEVQGHAISSLKDLSGIGTLSDKGGISVWRAQKDLTLQATQ